MSTGPALRPDSLWGLYVVRETVSELDRISHSVPPDSIKSIQETLEIKKLV